MIFERVLVAGAGQMGAGIAQVVAASGREVLLYDAVPGAVERGLATMEKSLARLHEKGGPAPDEVLARVTPVGELVDADLLIEAIVEQADAKKELFREADAALPKRAVLASNTSSIPITELASATSRPERVTATMPSQGQGLRSIGKSNSGSRSIPKLPAHTTTRLYRRTHSRAPTSAACAGRSTAR